MCVRVLFPSLCQGPSPARVSLSYAPVETLFFKIKPQSALKRSRVPIQSAPAALSLVSGSPQTLFLPPFQVGWLRAHRLLPGELKVFVGKKSPCGSISPVTRAAGSCERCSSSC